MKKVLSLVLSLALVLSSFSMAFADETNATKASTNLSDIAASTNKEAIEVVNDLGIVAGFPDGTFRPNEEVTRAQFAVMITKALAIPESILSGYRETTFKDMADYQWAKPYIAFCQSAGIMFGDGQGNAMPGRTVKLTEAVTMALRAIGYKDHAAELRGKWPANYAVKAQELNMYEDLDAAAPVANRETAAQLIYNLLTQQKVAVADDGKMSRLWDTYDATTPTNNVETTLLTSGLNATREDASTVDVDDLDNSSINMAKYLGMYGTKYTAKTGKHNKIIAFMPAKDYKMLVGRVTESGKEFVTTADDKTYDFENAAVMTTYLENGEKKTVVTLASLAGATAPEVAVFAKLNGKTILGNNTTPGKERTLTVNKWSVNADKKVDENDISEIKSKRLLGKKFAKDDDEAIDVKSFQLMGVANLDDIKVDNVVYVYVAKKEIVRVDVGTEVVEGNVKNFKDGKQEEGTYAVFTIGENKYMNAYTKTDSDSDKAAVGVQNFASGHAAGISPVVLKDVAEDVKIFLDARGFVYDAVKTSKADRYALVIKEDTNFDHRAELMLSDGTKDKFPVNLEKASDRLGDIKKTTNAVTGEAYGLVAYGVNSKGEISDKDKEMKVIEFANKSIEFKNNSYVAVGTPKSGSKTYYNIKKDAVVFMYEDDSSAVVKSPGNADVDFSLTSLDKINKEANKDIVRALIDKNEPDKIYALIVSDRDAKSGDNKYAVINKTVVTSVDGTKVLAVEGLIDGVEFSKNTDDRNNKVGTHDAKYADGNSKVNLYEVTLDKDGVIVNAKEIVEKADSNINNDSLINSDTKHNTRFAQVAEVSDRDSIKLGNGRYLAIDSKAIYYKLNKDAEYELFTGVPRINDFVKAYELDGEGGYDVVFVVTPNDTDVVSVVTPAGVNANGGDGEFTIKTAGTYIVQTPDGKYSAIKASSGNYVLDPKDPQLAADAAIANSADDKVKGLENGKSYRLIKVEQAYMEIVGENQIKGEEGKTAFSTATGTKDNDTVVINLVGVQVKTNSDIAITDFITGGATDVNGTKVDVKMEAVTKGDMKLTIKGTPDSVPTAFVQKAVYNLPSQQIDKGKFDNVAYDGGDIIYVNKATHVKFKDAAGTKKVQLVVRAAGA